MPERCVSESEPRGGNSPFYNNCFQISSNSSNRSMIYDSQRGETCWEKDIERVPLIRLVSELEKDCTFKTQI
jgi:hypothetical protein